MFAMLSRFQSLIALGDRLPTRATIVRPLKDPRVILRAVGNFIRTSYTDGVRALIAGRYSHRQAAYIMAASVPALLGVAVVTIPALLFNSPSHQAFYHFADTLTNDPAALIPTVIGTISTTLGFRVPLG